MSAAACGDANGAGLPDLISSGGSNALRLFMGTVGTGCQPPCTITARILTDNNGDATDTNTSDEWDAIGARVVVDLDGDGYFLPGGYTGPDRIETYLVRQAQGGRSTHNQLPLLIGSGQRSSADHRVTFVDGSVVTLREVAAGPLEIRAPP